MLPLQSVADLALYMGVDETVLTAYASQAILQSTLLLSIKAQLDNSDYDGLVADDQAMVNMGILDMAEYVYLRQPYKQLIASPLTNETIGPTATARPSSRSAATPPRWSLAGRRPGASGSTWPTSFWPRGPGQAASSAAGLPCSRKAAGSTSLN